jgi:decaprenylphospho-beta-D-ribofuranose 2-oxidase
MLISGWGGYPTVEANVSTPSSAQNCELLDNAALIPRGMGRSYGDSALAANVLQTRRLDHFLVFEPVAGLLTVEAGVTIREILRLVVPKGWFVPVTPGTSYVTIGGAIASDVHGKNHHSAGTFGQHVTSINMLLGSGEIVHTSPQHLPDLFHATCGGMGLTGLILSATIQLQRLSSVRVCQTTLKSSCLEEVCELFEAQQHSAYSVAWIDCLTQGSSLGRSVLMLGEHDTEGGLSLKIKEPLAVPFYTPAALLNSASMKAFNQIYYAKAQHGRKQNVHLFPYFYPLDALGGWNKLYGRPGFLQYQFVIPKEHGVKHMKTMLQEIAKAGTGSFLAVLKQFGRGNNNLLSFPREGYTLALDFKMTDSTVALLHRLDDMLLSMGGRVYLTKDAVMKASTFKAAYPTWEAFESVRHKFGAVGKFASAQSKRLGLL